MTKTTAPKCGNEIDFHDDGCISACDRGEGHQGRHSFTGAAAIQTWEDR